ncbi:glycoside hydrolase family 16 protein [Flavihumibacter sp. CACIAM 22H1]|uniref:glycoside hydrolase family 16 protein n=1 Tax=Flavihumibacter sp. CACIAM 22H1 TaxID=1812911 RepID=UPI0007A888A2|nr:glycoside hydrolase family 16 protein [Flavihumibacter sp. CACIAM 22H1]KYP15042.1 MAG: hypothetical protein A1D16_01225 [Flavihumibacter sp. CACIAM 22H1]
MNYLVSLLIGLFLSAGVTAQQWKLVWSDEFTQPGMPDPKKWAYEIGANGWGNKEKQEYTRADSKTASVRNGSLFITAYKSAEGNYYSSRLVTRGLASWRFGRIEIRARLPKGRGIGAAIWMLPADDAYGDWPASGEIDLMEFIGTQPDSIFTGLHMDAYNQELGNQKRKGHFLPMNWQDFHVYALEWLDDHIYFKIDGNIVYRFKKEKDEMEVWPFDQPFYLILNVAVGGLTNGDKGIDDSIFPQSMEIDYIRVSQPAAH